jgi:SNF2 family DNA or RNA helicase
VNIQLDDKTNSNLQTGCSASSFSSMTNLVMELRKCCNHPYLIKGVETAFAANQVH